MTKYRTTTFLLLALMDPLDLFNLGDSANQLFVNHFDHQHHVTFKVPGITSTFNKSSSHVPWHSLICHLFLANSGTLSLINWPVIVDLDSSWEEADLHPIVILPCQQWHIRNLQMHGRPLRREYCSQTRWKTSWILPCLNYSIVFPQRTLKVLNRGGGVRCGKGYSNWNFLPSNRKNDSHLWLSQKQKTKPSAK